MSNIPIINSNIIHNNSNYQLDIYKCNKSKDINKIHITNKIFKKSSKKVSK